MQGWAMAATVPTKTLRSKRFELWVSLRRLAIRVNG
jgi:hypothetical protein